ncbi:putative dehydrogenase [Abditibacterium utsteinense]|uniref:Putative dehydrogenase n=1 Tax=Abditibacterium utsteinense TaxID=1960156 RepID=A0A2S8SR89_9BACT|nr:aldo/keto reductase [Abditibacterium utsteinense]PQV63310.1 putative dehydrogenase [Abditibacterium utsteinense]
MTDISTLRWGILGAGSIAKTFARGLGESQTGTLVAIGSRTQDSADKFGAEFGLQKRYASYEALLSDTEIDAVYIATPHPMHAQWAIKAADAKKHVLCEKPLTLNHGEAMAVVEAARENGVLLMEAFMYRCHPQTAKIVELVQSGAIGEVKLITASFGFQAGFNAQSRLFNPDLGGGGILDVGCYCASMVRLIAGAATGQAFANPQQVLGAGHLGQSGVDEIAAATLKFPGDILAQISTSVALGQENVVRIFGTKGDLLVSSPWFCAPGENQPNLILNRDGKSEEIFAPGERNLYAYEADAFFEATQKGAVQSPAMSGEDALGNMASLDAWRAQIKLVYPAELPENHVPARGKLEKRADAKMQYGRVAGIDKPISRLVMGCDNQETFSHAAAMFDDFWERGGNAFDTGYIYGGGLMERLLGQWIGARGLREQAMIIGKGVHPPHCNPEGLTRQLGETLDRLQTEYVDLYLMHRDNLNVPIGDWIEVLNGHLQAGRIRAFGGSNWSLARVDAGNAYAKEHGLVGFSALSNNFSLARMVDPVWSGCVSASDAASRAWLTQNQLPVFAWSSQARGFFVRGDRNFTADEELVRCWYSDDNFQRLERAKELARQKNTTPINVAAAYVLAQPFPLFALIGPRFLTETRSSMGAFDVQLSPDEVKWLNLES